MVAQQGHKSISGDAMVTHASQLRRNVGRVQNTQHEAGRNVRRQDAVATQVHLLVLIHESRQLDWVVGFQDSELVGGNGVLNSCLQLQLVRAGTNTRIGGNGIHIVLHAHLAEEKINFKVLKILPERK